MQGSKTICTNLVHMSLENRLFKTVHKLLKIYINEYVSSHDREECHSLAAPKVETACKC